MANSHQWTAFFPVFGLMKRARDHLLQEHKQEAVAYGYHSLLSCEMMLIKFSFCHLAELATCCISSFQCEILLAFLFFFQIAFFVLLTPILSLLEEAQSSLND